MALYAASYNFVTAVLFLPMVLNRVTMAVINQQKGIRSTSGYRSVFRLNVALTLVSTAGAAGLVCLFAAPLLRIFGKGFIADGPSVLFLLMAATIPESLTIALDQLIQSQSRMWLAVSAVNLPRDISLPVAAWWLTPLLGARGLALGYLAARVIGLVMIVLVTARIGTKPGEPRHEDPVLL
jgi:O-antigen/teichoic acid export membrane protein